MQSYQIIIINGTLRAIGAFLLLSRRAHLLTTHKMGGGTAKAAVRSPRGAAPSEPCGSCRKAVTFRAVACPTTALSTLYHSLDSVGIAAATPSITHKNSQYFLTRRCSFRLYELLQDFERLRWCSPRLHPQARACMGAYLFTRKCSAGVARAE